MKTNMKTNMKNKYTKKQITEAIAYWQKRLAMLDESSDWMPQTYFVQIFICDKHGTIKQNSFSGDDELRLERYPVDADLNRTFKNKNQAISAARQASKQLKDYFYHDDDAIDDAVITYDLSSIDDLHILAVVRKGDEWGSDIVACLIDGRISPTATIEAQLK